jgi:hypothetical protein
MSESPMAIAVMSASILLSTGCADGEVSDPSFECDGRFEISSEGDLAAIVPCVTIEGGLWLTDQTWLENVDLPYLEKVDGPLLISWNDNLQQVHLPVLERV